MIDFSVVIQAGGASKRMGRDKALVPFLDSTMIEYVLAQVRVLGRETLIISNKPADYQRFGLPVFADVIPDIGALGGVYSALYYINTEYCLLMACDMPYVNLDVIQLLLDDVERYDVVVPRLSGGFIEPMRAVYSKKCIPEILKTIESGSRKVTSFFNRVAVRYLDELDIKKYDPGLYSFFNVNMPEDLAKAQQLAKSNWGQKPGIGAGK